MTTTQAQTPTTATPMSRRIFTATALLCAGAWLVKQAAIAAADGGESTLIGVLWGIGMLSFLAAAAAGAATFLARRPLWLRIAGAVIAVPVSFLLFSLADGAAQSVYTGSGWFGDELGLVFSGLAMATLALVTRGGSRSD